MYDLSNMVTVGGGGGVGRESLALIDKTVYFYTFNFSSLIAIRNWCPWRLRYNSMAHQVVEVTKRAIANVVMVLRVSYGGKVTTRSTHYLFYPCHNSARLTRNHTAPKPKLHTTRHFQTHSGTCCLGRGNLTYFLPWLGTFPPPPPLK